MTNKQKAIKVGAIVLAIFIIINIFSLIVNIINSTTNIFLGNYNTKEILFSKTYDEFTKIKIDIPSANITIESGDEFKVETTTIDKELKVKLNNNILNIEEKESWININNKTNKIIITIPKNTVLEELDIESGAGKILMNNIEINKFDIEQGAGLLKINNSTIHESNIEGGAGEIKIANTILNDLELDSGVGRVELKGSITGTSEINCGIGEIDIILLDNKDDYKIIVSKGIGSIKINDELQDNGTIYGDGFNKLKIDGGIGSININFK